MSGDDPLQARKLAAVRFLQLVEAGQIEEAYRKYVDPRGRHHNPFFPAGFPALQKGMIENQAQFPHKQLSIQHVLGDGDLVAVHSHIVLSPDGPGVAAVHLFRFQDDRIVELWDCGQPVPEASPNQDGMF